MSKIGRNKKACENYRLSGRKAENKAKRQVRHEKRLAYFAKRREEGKTYEYKPNPYPKDTNAYYEEKQYRAEKNIKHQIPLQKFTSIMAKLNNQLAKVRDERSKKAIPPKKEKCVI